MSEKVKVTREVSEAIETAINLDGTQPFQLVRDHVLSSGFARSDDHLRVIGTLGIDTLIRALYIGYEVEVEPTPREKAQKLLQKFYGFHPLDDLMKELESVYGVEDGVNA